MVSADGRYIYTIHNSLLTWQAAEAACASGGGHLAYVESQQECEALEAPTRRFWKEAYPGTADPGLCPHCGCASEPCWFVWMGYSGAGTDRSKRSWVHQDNGGYYACSTGRHGFQLTTRAEPGQHYYVVVQASSSGEGGTRGGVDSRS